MNGDTRKKFNVSDLEIVGYGNSFRKSPGIHVVPPIFRVRGKDTCVFPPFILAENLVINGQRGSYDDLMDACLERRATQFDKPIDAIANGFLWIDREFGVHYGPKYRERKLLKAISKKMYGESLSAFISGNYKIAVDLAKTSFSANTSSIMPLALHAASNRLQGKSDVVQREIFLSGNDMSNYAFESTVSELVDLAKHCEGIRKIPYVAA